jgi:hypothetical protein
VKVGRVDFGCLGLLEIGRLCEGGCYFRMRGAKVSIGKIESIVKCHTPPVAFF